MISGTHHQLGIVEDNLVANECQAINQTQEQPEDKSKADMIRERRSERLRKEPHHSIKIIICLNNGSRIKRSFDKGILFQTTFHRERKKLQHWLLQRLRKFRQLKFAWLPLDSKQYPQIKKPQKVLVPFLPNLCSKGSKHHAATEESLLI